MSDAMKLSSSVIVSLQPVVVVDPSFIFCLSSFSGFFSEAFEGPVPPAGSEEGELRGDGMISVVVTGIVLTRITRFEN